ncbi:hypothetical protein FACS1894152_8550 [Bacilli bacterium]|nr:hypothetical protein FACS1894152_8550 [Bacilli bacterium]
MNRNNKQNLSDLRREFEDAQMNTLLTTKVVAAAINKSIPWFHMKATYGGGIPYRKVGNLREYYKKDVLDWLEENSQRVHSTSEYRGRL